MYDSLWPQGLQHARLPCPSTTPGIHSNSCPFSWWCHSTISSSVVPFSSHLQTFPASGFFPVSQFFALGGQSIGVSASASVLPMNIQHWFPLGWTGWISLQSNRDSQESSPILHFKSINSSALIFLYSPILTSIHDYWKNHSLTRWTSVGKGMSLLFNMVSRLVIAFLPRSKLLLISWLQSLSVLISESKKRKSVTVSLVSPSTCHEMMEPDSYLLVTCFFLIKVLNLSGFRPEVVFLNKTKIKLCLLALYPVLFGKA